MSEHPCDRRTFLRQSGGCVALALTVLGIDGELAALPMTAEVGVAQGADRRYALPTADGVNIDGQVMVVRFQGRVFALSLVCPHEHAGSG